MTENANADNKFIVNTFSGAAAKPYDDIVMAATAGDLLAALTAGGGMGSIHPCASDRYFNVIKYG